MRVARANSRMPRRAPVPLADFWADLPVRALAARALPWTLVAGTSGTPLGSFLGINANNAPGGNLTYSGAIGGTGTAGAAGVSLNTLGTGTLTLTGTVDADTLMVSGGGTIALSGGSVTSDFHSNAVGVSNTPGTLLITMAGTYTSGSLKCRLWQPRTALTGGVNMTGGTWSSNGSFAIGRSGNGLFTVNGGTFQTTGAGEVRAWEGREVLTILARS